MFDCFLVLMGICGFEGVFVRLGSVVVRYGGCFLRFGGVFCQLDSHFDILLFRIALGNFSRFGMFIAYQQVLSTIQ